MPVPQAALACAVGAGLLAAVAVAQSRIGLGLSLMLMSVIAAGVAAAPRPASRPLTALAAALATQAAWRDAGWVVAVDVLAASVAGAAAVGATARWADVVRTARAPWRLVAGGTAVGRSLSASHPIEVRRATPVIRGLALATALTALFGGLLISADRAFARVLEDAVAVDVDLAGGLWRITLGVLVTAAAGALTLAGRPPRGGPARAPRGDPGRMELVIALAALIALFAGFAAVQLRVLLNGAEYVRSTTGLGYGEYARHGFVQLVAATALTLAVVAFTAARRRDRLIRGQLAALCLLTLVALAGAVHRLDLVQQAYGLTRVRYAGYALLTWITVILVLTLAAGAHRGLARRLPHVMTVLTLSGALLFSLSNPDGRIADRAVQRAVDGRPVDTAFLSGLSADALPALMRLPGAERTAVVPVLRDRLRRPDGITGLNLSRRRAR